jgi:oligoribonuclease NrnB/cAMP/cGMP phosphodiesterase (DHH superfamily)
VIELLPKSKNHRILSITHQQDIDGLFCGAILKNTFPDSFVYLTNYGYNNMLKIANTIENNTAKSTKGGTIIISDLSADDIREIENIRYSASKAKGLGWNLIWIDHHFWRPEVKEMVKTFGTLILSGDSNNKCASEMVCDYLDIKRTACIRMAKFAHAADFRTNDISKYPPLPELVKYYLSLPAFYKKLQVVVSKASRGVFWDEEFQEDYESKYLPLKKVAIMDALETLTVTSINNYKIGVIESPKILSKAVLAEIVFENQNDLDLVFLYAPDGKVSVRRKKGSSIRCDVIAQKMGGGGHEYAAAGVIRHGIDNSPEEGIKIEKKDVLDILKNILT